jgi:hypothetical protein
MGGYSVESITRFWNVVQTLLPWASVRALRDLADPERKAAYEPIRRLLPDEATLEPWGLLPDSAGEAARDLLFAEEMPAAGRLRQNLLYPLLEQIALREPARLEARFAGWINDLCGGCAPLEEAQVRELACRGRLSARQLALAGARLCDQGLRALCALPESTGRNAAVLVALSVLESTADRNQEVTGLLELWCALHGREQEAATVRRGLSASGAARGLPGEKDSNGASNTETTRQVSLPALTYRQKVPVYLRRRLGLGAEDRTALAALEQPDHPFRAWLEEAVKEPLFEPFWDHLVPRVITHSVRPGTPRGHECEAALLALLDTPPPPDRFWLLRLLSAVRRTWRGETCLPWKEIRKLIDLIPELSGAVVQRQVVIVCLEGLLPVRAGRRLGLGEQVACLRDLAIEAHPSRPVLDHLRRMEDACRR